MNEKDFFPKTLLCNSRKELKKNLLLSSRIYPETNCNLNMFPRSITKVCNKYVDCEGMLSNHNQCRNYNLPTNSNLRPNLVHDCNYMKNIDKETQLFGITKKNKTENLINNNYGNNNLLDEYFDTNYMSYNNTTKNLASGENTNHHTIALNIDNHIQKKGITLNDRTINNVCDNKNLVLGNLPAYHTSEKFWNNNTKRKLNTQTYLNK